MANLILIASAVESFLTLTSEGEAQSLMLGSMRPALSSLLISSMAAFLSLAGIGYGDCATGVALPVGMSMTTRYDILGTLASTDHT